MEILHEPAANDNMEMEQERELNGAAAMQALVTALERAVALQVGRECSFAERERAVLKIGNEAQRRHLERDLQVMADAHSDELLIDEVLHRKHQRGTGDYPSLCGNLHVSRATFDPPPVL